MQLQLKRSLLCPFLIALVAAAWTTLACFATCAGAAEPPDAVKWVGFPDSRLEVRGLPWFDENSPELWRFPARAEGKLPGAVWRRALYPVGGRIRFATNSSQLHIRLAAADEVGRLNMSAYGSRGLDVYVNGAYWSSVLSGGANETTMTFFSGADRARKEIVIYLPLFQELRVLAIGMDKDSELVAAAPYADPRPLVLYGSSVAQGSGAGRPGMTYEAILARRLNLDFVNLGFGGAGKAEVPVVNLVAQIDACCFVFDLGKSYGMQNEEPYYAMLAAIRRAHADTPLVCITPIFSTRENYSQEYSDRSKHTRDVARRAVRRLVAAGDKHVYLIEGLDLLGSDDADGFHETIHPNDLGYTRIAERLQPLIKEILSQRTLQSSPIRN